MASRPYAGEEVLSFDRIKRAVTSRVLEIAEPAIDGGRPLDNEKLAELIDQEMKAVKAAVLSSPAAREEARKRIGKVVGGMIEGMEQTDKSELEDLGVKEKYI